MNQPGKMQKKAAVAAVVLFVLALTSATKADPLPGACAYPPLSDLTLQSTLLLLGYSTQDIGNKVYRFSVTQDRTTYRVNTFISTDGAEMYVTVGLMYANQLSPDLAVKMLKSSYQLPGSYFAVDNTLVELVHNYPNQCLDANAVRFAVLEIVSSAEKTRDLWHLKTTP
jgi:hypothetical protein